MVFMRSVLTLDFKGLVSALVLGIVLFVLGRSYGPLFFFSMLFFLIAAAVVTRVRVHEKKARGVYEPQRGWKNVWANGIVPLFIAAIYFLMTVTNSHADFALVIAYISSVAAITADKFSSELGVLDKRTFMLLTTKHVKTGVSGGVSVLGLAAGLLAAALVSGVFGFAYSFSPLVFVLVILAGFFGDIVDSVFGYFEELGFGNKFTTNIACAASAALLALAVFGVFYASQYVI